LREHDIIAVATGIADPELFQADIENGAFAFAVKRSEGGIGAVVIDNEELIAQGGREIEGNNERTTAQIVSPTNIQLIVTGSWRSPVKFDLELHAGSEVEVAASQ
jgi:hypothetical protein